MTRPDPAAVVLAVPFTIAAAVFATASVVCHPTWVALLLLMGAAAAVAGAVAALALFWHVPGEDDLMAVADATRERQWPSLPAEWSAED